MAEISCPSGGEDGAGEEGPFIPAEARPAVVEDLARTAWQVAEILPFLEAPGP
ncbi:hypothetical protein [Amycolatopsis pigmentata]|uniref:Uncharacterized protein n=1 Tax=Amycolatopsis pigmentata TaxID=450801 RepID=A0ABW5FNS2_9PSEU